MGNRDKGELLTRLGLFSPDITEGVGGAGSI